MFSPGKVTAKTKTGIVLEGFQSHAEFEKECSRCHRPLDSDLASTCLQCHVSVNEEMTIKKGLHSTLLEPRQCASCHLEHKGQDFDPSFGARFLYNHDLARFNLIHHKTDFDDTPIDCEGCHSGPDFAFNEIQCKDCHEFNQMEFISQHIQDFSLACLDCHDGLDRMANFDHAATNFQLDGVHSETRCVSCHLEGKFAGTPVNCRDCHAEPEIHADLFQDICSDCHTTTSWLPAMLDNQAFEHSETTGFSLIRHTKNFNNQAIRCVDCHSENIQQFNLTTCIDCHSNQDQVFMTDHQVKYSSACLECHDGFDGMINFDHNRVFVLDGRHAEIACQDCHIDQTFASTSPECVACHAEPEIHAGSFGTDCQYCHQTTAWQPALLRQHNFPLDHGSDSQLACETCHNVTYAQYTCYECHEHQPGEIEAEHRKEGISPEGLVNCTKCHPTGLKEDH